ncbi:carbohydrate ABC transporter permease, partial [Marinomonas arenicola]
KNNPVARKTSGVSKVLRIALYTVLLVMAVFYLMPLVIMLITSLKDSEEVRNGTLLSLPAYLHFDSWTKAWSGACTGSTCTGISPYF